ncbi:outer mitochondrial transmembrane helix translocase-like [Watersipora subatra]|uniref:outer mitochondrial transmembrane helix translocase-like n=1 Tax=Watersipora subatra TaxID=2589382 RepID=UPI00355B9EB6
MGSVFSQLKFRNMPAKTRVELLSTLLGFGLSLGTAYLVLSQILKRLDPTGGDKHKSQEIAKKMIKKLGIELSEPLSEYELCIASNLVDTNTITIEWKDIGGLQHIIEEINEVIILPFTRPDLFRSSALLQPPKGVLLYGPPGCGKTMLAKATAKAAGARFINLQASALFDKWYGESQKRAEAIFSLAARIEPTIIFIDEIDAFLRSRDASDHESTAMVKAQFMSLWDGLCTDAGSKVLIMGATNRPMDVDPAFRRRMPCMLQIGMPREQDREQILGVILKDEQIGNKETVIKEMAAATDQLSGSDLKELCRHAALFRVWDYINSERVSPPARNLGDFPQLRQMNLQDFKRALEKFRNMSLQ